MSVQTSFKFLHSNHPSFVAAQNDPEEKEKWEDYHGSMEETPGKQIDCEINDFVQETEDEYGGWIIDVRNLPPGTTHIKIDRG